MTFEHTITVLNDAQVLSQCGPMRLVIQAWKDGQLQIETAKEAGKISFSFLERVARLRRLLSVPANDIQELPDDKIARKMIQSTKAIGDKDLTPMAAVAGTIADFVADWLFDRGMTKVVVDNGGDVSVRLSRSESVTVGIRSDILRQEISHVLRLDAQQASWGITTSGVGGRSFTRGIASAVTAIARNASMADAAATAIANACYIDDERIVQVPAEQLDPDTDLIGVPVTVQVGPLGPEKISIAVMNALQKAERLSRADVIIAALIASGNIFSSTESMCKFLTRSITDRFLRAPLLQECQY